MGEERIAIYPGTFDPLTSGHESLIRRGLEVFDTVIVGFCILTFQVFLVTILL